MTDQPVVSDQTYPGTEIRSGSDVVFRVRYASAQHWSTKTAEQIRRGVARELAFRARLDQELAELHRRLADAHPEYKTEIATLPTWAVLDQGVIDPATGHARSHARYGCTDYVLTAEGGGRGEVDIDGRVYRIEVEPWLVIAALMTGQTLDVTATGTGESR